MFVVVGMLCDLGVFGGNCGIDLWLLLCVFNCCKFWLGFWILFLGWRVGVSSRIGNGVVGVDCKCLCWWKRDMVWMFEDLRI